MYKQARWEFPVTCMGLGRILPWQHIVPQYGTAASSSYRYTMPFPLLIFLFPWPVPFYNDRLISYIKTTTPETLECKRSNWMLPTSYGHFSQSRGGWTASVSWLLQAPRSSQPLPLHTKRARSRLYGPGGLVIGSNGCQLIHPITPKVLADGVLGSLSRMSLIKQLPGEPVCSVSSQIFFTSLQSELRLLFGLKRRRGSVVRGDDQPIHFIGHLAHFLQRSNQFSSLANGFPAIASGAPRRATGLLARVALCDRRSEQVKSLSAVHHGHCRGDGEDREEWRRDLMDAHDRAGNLENYYRVGKMVRSSNL